MDMLNNRIESNQIKSNLNVYVSMNAHSQITDDIWNFLTIQDYPLRFSVLQPPHQLLLCILLAYPDY